MDINNQIIISDIYKYEENITHISNKNNTNKNSVATTTITNIDLDTDLKIGDIIDDIVLQLNTRVLVKNQTNSIENGIYQITETGEKYRSFDLKNGNTCSGVMIVSLGGSANSNKIFICTNETGTDILSRYG